MLDDGSEDTLLGEVLIRCNNVLYIRPVAQERYIETEVEKTGQGRIGSKAMEVEAESSSDEEN